MNSRQRRKLRRLYEAAFGPHVDYWMIVQVGPKDDAEIMDAETTATLIRVMDDPHAEDAD